MQKVLYMFMVLFVVAGLSGCNEGHHSEKIALLGGIDRTTQNPNSIANIAKEKSEERKNRVELSKIEADAKIKIAQLKMQTEMNVAKLQAQTQQEVVKANSLAKITSTKLDASTRKETMQYTVYIVIAVAVFLLMALFLLYLNSRKNRELKKQLQEDQFRHEKALHEKELEEKRLHKVLDLVAAGKMPSNIEDEVLLSISKPKNKLIEAESV